MINFKEIYKRKYEGYKNYILEHQEEKDVGLDKIVNNKIKAYSIQPIPRQKNTYLIQIWEKQYDGIPDYSYNITFDEQPKKTYINIEINDSVKAFISEVDEIFNNSNPISMKFPDGSEVSIATAIAQAGWESIKKYYLGDNDD